MIVKQNVEQSNAETDHLQTDLTQLEQQDASLHQSIALVHAETLNEIQNISRTQADVAVLKNEAAKKSDAVTRKKMALSRVQDTIKNAPKAKQDDVLQDDRGGEENYIMGIKVEGRKIVLLVDSSASMTDEKLIHIIRRKNTADSNKKRGPKWQRSKRIVRWLLARAPKSSRVSVVAYNRTAKVLGGADWLNNRDAESMKKLHRDLDKLVPTGPTNLQLGLQKAAALKPTDIYLLTDGLPTAGQSRYASLNPFAACSSLLGKSSNISGECRVKLFRQSVHESAPKGGVKINVILLPIEGDPQAAPEYWAWSASTGGLLISPALSWP
ncbi:MAG: VWA domain-containing protein [Mariprofundaceae bacterium]